MYYFVPDGGKPLPGSFPGKEPAAPTVKPTALQSQHILTHPRGSIGHCACDRWHFLTENGAFQLDSVPEDVREWMCERGEGGVV